MDEPQWAPPPLPDGRMVRFILCSGQELVCEAHALTEEEYLAYESMATEIDWFCDAVWERTHDDGWLLMGTKENGLRLPLRSIEGTGE